MVLHRYRISNPYVLKYIDNPKFTQTAKSNLENKDSKTGVLNLQGCKDNIIFINYSGEGHPQPIENKIEYISMSCSLNIILENFLDIISNLYKESEPNILNIYVTTHHSEWNKYNKIPKRTIESVYIDEKIKSKLVDDINLFISSEEKYNNF